jgi:hypothetical protein
MTAGERKARQGARTSALAKRREGTTEILWLPEKEQFESEISLDLDDRDIVFSSSVSSIPSEKEKMILNWRKLQTASTVQPFPP